MASVDGMSRVRLPCGSCMPDEDPSTGARPRRAASSPKLRGRRGAGRGALHRHLDGGPCAGGASASGGAACSSAATRRTCSRRPAAWATTPRSKMRSTSAGSWPPSCAGRRRRHCWTATRPNASRWPCATPRYARRFADSIGLFRAQPELEEDSPRGEAARAAGRRATSTRHARLEFNIPGVTFGGRYDGSPRHRARTARTPPADEPNSYVPTACPGGRAAACVAAGRPLAVRSVRARLDAAGAG